MPLADRVRMVRRFRRAVRIDTDLRDPDQLAGFVCPRSSAVLLETMAQQVRETGQGAFTWTGPYGGGKSSLAVALGALLDGRGRGRAAARRALGDHTARSLLEAFPPGSAGWKVVPVVGRRDPPVRVIGEAIKAARCFRKYPATWSEEGVLEALGTVAMRRRSTTGGLLFLVDELGKFLEGAARDGADIHIFQQLAEKASRSGGRLLFIGILHQSFDAYAHRLSREARDEWAKIQGRFTDLPVNPAPEEQIDLLGRAIQGDRPGSSGGKLEARVAALLSPGREAAWEESLKRCWPLHPVTACLLGPLSRRRFGQNQRSLFAFLNSAEPQGFRDFLADAEGTDLYGPDRLWDYLQLNLEPSILASPDGHRWALAADTLARCEARGGGALHARLLKVIALADLLSARSRLRPGPDLLECALPDQRPGAIGQAVAELHGWSLIRFRRFEGAWGVFEGSDFDIDKALAEARPEVEGRDAEVLVQAAGLKPILAKRHYHETGALRWFELEVVPLADLQAAAAGYEPRRGAIGCFLLGVPTRGESRRDGHRLVRDAAAAASDSVVTGVFPAAWDLPAAALELATLEVVRDTHPELHGDRVARTEVRARIEAVRERLEHGLGRAFDTAEWVRPGATGGLSRADLNGLASDLASKRFAQAPHIRNELVNRARPSSSAVAARNALMRRMATREREKRLGIEGFPAYGGLYDSLLRASGLHRNTGDGWRFVAPDPDGHPDPCRLAPLWKAGREVVKRRGAGSDSAPQGRDNQEAGSLDGGSRQVRTVPISRLYEAWRKPPYGVKEGLLPVLAVAFLQTESENLAIYREGAFQSQLSSM